MVINEELKPLTQPLFSPMIFSQRRHNLRMVDNKTRIQTIHFQKVSHKFIQQPGGGSGISAFHFVLETEFV
jgi:hypothetical protein